MVLVGDVNGLDEIIAGWQTGQEQQKGAGPLGIVPLMEGADPIREPAEAELWYERGLRIVGLAWDDTRYAAGAWRDSGRLTSDGRQLLEVMADLARQVRKGGEADARTATATPGRWYPATAN